MRSPICISAYICINYWPVGFIYPLCSVRSIVLVTAALLCMRIIVYIDYTSTHGSGIKTAQFLAVQLESDTLINNARNAT